MPKVRAFIAIELPDRIRLDIASLQKDLASAGLKLRWVKSQNLHLTLKFLGDMNRETIADICNGLTAVTSMHPEFELQPSGIGCFPGLKNSRGLWTGISGTLDGLRTLQADVENALRPFGFKVEKRPFRGHLTIGRVKSRLNPHKLAEALRAHQGFYSDAFTVKQVTLFQSKLQPNGPVYTKLCESPLGASM